jgi:amidohydrolase
MTRPVPAPAARFKTALLPAALSAALLLAPAARPALATPSELAGLDALYPSLDALYLDLHRNPELSSHEEKTSAKLAARLRAAGFEVTEHVGGFGVVAVLRNGKGPTVLVRTDMDALPVKEQTGLAYASAVTTKNDAGETVPVMHACGHDIHMTSWVGAASLLAGERDRWHGTLVFVGQPAEETGAGAIAMLKDDFLARFPKPDFALALHDTMLHPSGQVGITPGFAMTNNDFVDVVIYGKGGHGAQPHRTIDPVLIAARFVVALQGIVAREVNPLDPSVITVGSIHGGTKHNIIPDEVKLQLTVRSYKPEVQKQLLAAIERVAKGEAAASGAPKPPLVTHDPDKAALSLYNDPALTQRLAGALRRALGDVNVAPADPVMVSEDFGAFGTAAKVPSVLLWLGAAEPSALAKAQEAGTPLPNWHTAWFAPDRERTLRTGASAITVSVLELLGK